MCQDLAEFRKRGPWRRRPWWCCCWCHQWWWLALVALCHHLLPWWCRLIKGNDSWGVLYHLPQWWCLPLMMYGTFDNVCPCSHEGVVHWWCVALCSTMLPKWCRTWMYGTWYPLLLGWCRPLVMCGTCCPSLLGWCRPFVMCGSCDTSLPLTSVMVWCIAYMMFVALCPSVSEGDDRITQWWRRRIKE